MGRPVEVPEGLDESVVVRAARRRAPVGEAAPTDVAFAAVGVGVRIWIAVVVTLVFGVGAWIAIGQIHHDNGCTQYRNALTGATADPLSPADNADLAILSASDRKTVMDSLAAFKQAEGNGTTQAQQLASWDRYARQQVPESLAEHGC